MISVDFKLNVLAHTDLVDLIGKHVELVPDGACWKGCCPFHRDDRFSFTIFPEKQIFYCQDCHKTGDAITFVRAYEGRSFPDAVGVLASRAGLAPVSPTGPRGAVYILELADKHFYVGFTKNLGLSLQMHFCGNGPCFTRTYNPIGVTETCKEGSLELAVKRLQAYISKYSSERVSGDTCIFNYNNKVRGRGPAAYLADGWQITIPFSQDAGYAGELAQPVVQDAGRNRYQVPGFQGSVNPAKYLYKPRGRQGLLRN